MKTTRSSRIATAVFAVAAMLAAGSCGNNGRDPNCVCIEIFQPVCGTDGVTYANACLAGCASVDIASEGECP